MLVVVCVCVITRFFSRILCVAQILVPYSLTFDHMPTCIGVVPPAQFVHPGGQPLLCLRQWGHAEQLSGLISLAAAGQRSLHIHILTGHMQNLQ